jgi:hypothetical protein
MQVQTATFTRTYRRKIGMQVQTATLTGVQYVDWSANYNGTFLREYGVE